MKTSNAGAVSSIARCEGRKSNGSACGAPPLSGKSVCFWHSDDKEVQMLAARKGGLMSRPRPLPPDTPNPQFGSLADIRVFMESITGSVARGELSPQLSNAVTYSAQVAMRSLELEFGSRIDRIERVLEAEHFEEVS